MYVMAVKEKGFEPSFFEFRVAIEKFGDSGVFDLHHFNVVSGLGFTLRIFFVGEIVCIQNAAYTANEIELSILVFKLLANRAFENDGGNFDLAVLADDGSAFGVGFFFGLHPEVNKFLGAKGAEEWAVGEHFTELDFFYGDIGVSDFD